MSKDILEYLAHEAAFIATPIGAAFRNFRNNIIHAWILDTEDAFTDRDRKSTKLAHEKAIIAENEFRKLLQDLMTTHPDYRKSDGQ